MENLDIDTLLSGKDEPYDIPMYRRISDRVRLAIAIHKMEGNKTIPDVVVDAIIDGVIKEEFK